MRPIVSPRAALTIRNTAIQDDGEDAPIPQVPPLASSQDELVFPHTTGNATNAITVIWVATRPTLITSVYCHIIRLSAWALVALEKQGRAFHFRVAS
jgi:hypothetical protein